MPLVLLFRGNLLLSISSEPGLFQMPNVEASGLGSLGFLVLSHKNSCTLQKISQLILWLKKIWCKEVIRSRTIWLFIRYTPLSALRPCPFYNSHCQTLLHAQFPFNLIALASHHVRFGAESPCPATTCKPILRMECFINGVWRYRQPHNHLVTIIMYHFISWANKTVKYMQYKFSNFISESDCVYLPNIRVFITMVLAHLKLMSSFLLIRN